MYVYIFICGAYSYIIEEIHICKYRYIYIYIYMYIDGVHELYILSAGMMLGLRCLVGYIYIYI
jgi:hypothetical protein